MKFSMEKVDKNAFRCSTLLNVFNNSQSSRRYMFLTCGSNGFKVEWQSDLVEPVVITVNTEIVAIGVDLYFALLDIKAGKIIKTFDLEYFFIDAFLLKKRLYIVTELSVVIVELSDLTSQDQALPDLYSSRELFQDYVEIECMNGETVKL